MSDSEPHSNRRACRRRTPRGSTRVTCLKGSWGLGANLAVTLLNVSEDGVQLIVRSALEKGQEIEVSLLSPARSRPLTALAQVVWSAATPDGNCRVGARFQRRLSYVDLVDLTTQGTMS